MVAKLFGRSVEAHIATVFDGEGKESARHVLVADDKPPVHPGGGKAKIAPLSRIGYRQRTST
jgi:type I restriction enzyme M protein